MHAASVIDRRWKGEAGFSACRIWKGREFDNPVAEFGGRASYAPAVSVGNDKFNVRWKEGAWLGARIGWRGLSR